MSMSELEAKFRSLWDRRGLVGGPEWVVELPDPEREHRFHPTRLWRFDFAWLAYRVAVECEGNVCARGGHLMLSNYLSDIIKYNAAAALDWRVLRYSVKDMYERPVQVIQEVCNLLRKGVQVELETQLPLFK